MQKIHNGIFKQKFMFKLDLYKRKILKLTNSRPKSIQMKIY